jgi:hypothetical protein
MPEDGGDPTLLTDLARDQLGYLLGSADAAETKTGIFFGVGSTLVGLLVAIVALKPPRTPWSIGCASGAGATYLTLTVFCLWVYRTDKWRLGPDVRLLAGKWRTRTAEANKWAVLQTLLMDYTDNTKPYGHKLLRTRVGATLLLAETLALGGLAVCIAWGL